MCSASNLQKYRKNFNAIKAGASVCQVISSAWSNLKIPHRHFTLTIPKILRRYFLYDRGLLSDPIRCAWESLKVFLQEAVPERNPIPGVIIAVQTFGDFLGFSPHAHVIVTDGCFYGDKGMFQVAPPLELEKLAHYIIRATLLPGAHAVPGSGGEGRLYL